MSDMLPPTELQIERMLARRVERGEIRALRSEILNALDRTAQSSGIALRWAPRSRPFGLLGGLAVAILAALLIVAWLVLLAGSRRPTEQPLGLIAYARDGSVYVVQPDGTGGRRVAEGSRFYHVFWSPDGRRIAFEDDTNVWVVGADGSGLTRVARGHGVAWADASHLSFLVDRTAGETVAIAGVDDGSYRELAAVAGLASPGASLTIDGIAWAPDGQRAVVAACTDCRRGGTGEQHLYLLDGSSIKPVFDGTAGSLRWSPTGKAVAFWTQLCTPATIVPPACAGDIMVLVAKTGSSVNVTVDAAPDSDPAWSPDGRFLVFAHLSAFGEGVPVWLERADIDGSNRRRLTSPDGVAVLPVFEATGDWVAYAGATSPAVPSDTAPAPLDVWIVRIDGTGARKVVEGTNDFDWQPRVPAGSAGAVSRAAEQTIPSPPACTPPERPADAVASGCLVIPQTYTADLSTGRLSDGGGDLWFEAVSEVDRYLVPQARTRLARAGADGLAVCQAALAAPPPTGGPYYAKSEELPADTIAVRDLTAGSRVCVKTWTGDIVELIVLAVPEPLDPLVVQWVRWAGR